MKKKTVTYTLTDIIKQDLKSWSEEYEFPIKMYSSFHDALKGYLEKLIADKTCKDNKILIDIYEARLFKLKDNLVFINDVIKMLSGNNPENIIFRYRTAKCYGRLVNEPDDNEIVDKLCFAHMPSFNNTMSIAVTKSAITNKAKINQNVKKIKNLLKYTYIKNISDTTIKSKLTHGFKASKVIDSDTGKSLYVKKSDAMQLNLLRSRLNKLNWKLYYGLAGTGKSWNAINDVKKTYNKDTNVICATLANRMQTNLIERMIAAGIPKKQITGCSTNLGSYSKLDFTNCNNKNSFIIIDEMSQLGMDGVVMLNNMITKAPDANYIFMGDSNQIKSFLKPGSLLYSLISEFMGTKHVVMLNKNKRACNNKLNAAVDNFLNNNKIDKIFIPPKNYKITDYDVVITGANINVAQLNNKYVSEKFNIPSNMNISVNSVDYQDTAAAYDVDTRRMLVTAMRKGKTINLFGGKTGVGSYNKVKIINGEKWSAKYDNKTDMVRLTACIDPSRIIMMPAFQFIQTPYFDPGYAINVNKAQGLEWNKVLVKLNMDKQKGARDRNVYEKVESMYVSLSRGKEITHLDCNGSIGNICSRYKRVNNFKEAVLK